MLRILACSSSRSGNSAYLSSVVQEVKNFLGEEVKKIAFIPFASVGDYTGYLEKVQSGFEGLHYEIEFVEPGKTSVLTSADAIMIGGGNTFKLLHDLYANELMHLIREKVNAGTPYIGWSAGSNVTGLTISTTNDMPIIQPETFKAFGFLPFHINPHYINIKPEGFNGETRDQRLAEFVTLHQTEKVIGLPEGSSLVRVNNSIVYQGDKSATLFQMKEGEVNHTSIHAGDVSFMLGI